MKDYFGKNADSLKEKTLFLFDMDGTVYRENMLFNGVKELLSRISKTGKYVFVTNNSSKSVRDYVIKMERMGVDVAEENFFTSTQAAILLMKEKFGNSLIYVQGTSSFCKELKRGGLNITQKENLSARAVLVGFDTELTSKKLRTTCKMLTGTNLPFYATNPDFVCPVDFGYIPDCGSMCYGIERATGRKPVYIGKPEPMMIECAIKKFAAPKQQVVLLGDRLYTDIASGVNAGVDTVCVLSGETSLDDIKASEIKPTFVFHSVADIEFANNST